LAAGIAPQDVAPAIAVEVATRLVRSDDKLDSAAWTDARDDRPAARFASVSDPPVKLSVLPERVNVKPASDASVMTIRSPTAKSAIVSPFSPAAVSRKSSLPSPPVRVSAPARPSPARDQQASSVDRVGKREVA